VEGALFGRGLTPFLVVAPGQLEALEGLFQAVETEQLMDSFQLLFPDPELDRPQDGGDVAVEMFLLGDQFGERGRRGGGRRGGACGGGHSSIMRARFPGIKQNLQVMFWTHLTIASAS
jgi:hypothetical protein